MSNHLNADVSQKKDTRGVMAFPNIGDFYNDLMDRIHMLIDSNFLELPFTILLNARPRNHKVGNIIYEERYGDFDLVFAGMRRQREFLEAQKDLKTDQVDEAKLNKAWNTLSDPKKTQGFNTDTAMVSSILQPSFYEFSLNTIQEKGHGSLWSYFYDKKNNFKSDKLFLEEEFTILSAYFPIKKYQYLSVPLIQFAEFDGVVHVIYNKEEDKNFFRHPLFSKKKIRKDVVGSLITNISRVYEELILDWDMIEYGQYRRNFVLSLINSAVKPEFYRELQRNPILKELKYRDYYQKHQNYILDKIEYGSKVPLMVLDKYRRIAIMSILIDSYTHNISAHSLVAQEGWFHQRAIKHGQLQGELKQATSELPIIKRKESFDLEIQKMLNFLLDRGAFWTGLTRDYSFGGEVISIYQLLWQHFINNPLYLGTIAYTEGILKLSIHISIVKLKEIKEEGLLYEKEVILDGVFITIDLTQYNDAIELKKEGISGFIQKGTHFNEIKDLLEECIVFLPGGVVGRHSFFTILENEIRNVKHFPKSVRDEMKKNGLTLNISVDNALINKNLHEKEELSESFSIGVWLKHPTKIGKELIEDRLTRLWGDIILPESNKPLLGGTSQDKVCAAMLFNNSFSMVQKEEYERNDRYNKFFPWIKTGFSTEETLKKGELIEEWVFSARRILSKAPEFQPCRSIFENNFPKPISGFYKKYFHLWKGANVYTIESNAQLDREWENLSRFKFLFLAEKDESAYKKQFLLLRTQGIIRIIDQDCKSMVDAYNNWIPKWLKRSHQKQRCYLFVKDGAPLAVLHWDGQQVWHYWDDAAIEPFLGKAYTKELHLAHGAGQSYLNVPELRYRNHGIFKQYFCQNKELNEDLLRPDLAAELFETLATRICIYDNRVAQRVEGILEEKMQDLGCVFRKEEADVWENERGDRARTDIGFLKYHFLVIHLSFIETLTDINGKRYTEDRIDEFFKEEILKGKPLEDCPNNFILVVTSGRGRSQWLDSLDRQTLDKDINLLPHVTFRPIESLIGAVESALNKMDDFELKYLLTKLLMGS